MSNDNTRSSVASGTGRPRGRARPQRMGARQDAYFAESGTSPPTADVDLDQLAARWRQEAGRLRSLEAVGQAATLEAAASELEEANRNRALTVLSLSEAAAESGYSEDHLGRLLREGTIPNAGQPYSPRIRRCDLPRKPGFRHEDVDVDVEPITSREQIARAVVNSDTGGHDG